jgi:hypothetical protein
MISVEEFLELYATDDRVEIYDFDTEKTIFGGYKEEVDFNIGSLDVMSFDIEVNGLLIINVSADA